MVAGHLAGSGLPRDVGGTGLGGQVQGGEQVSERWAEAPWRCTRRRPVRWGMGRSCWGDSLSSTPYTGAESSSARIIGVNAAQAVSSPMNT
nr:hypothetical protein [Actinomadura hallensis]